MAIISGDVIRVTAKLSRGVDDIQNVYHVELTGATPPTDAAFMTQIATTLDTAYAFISASMWTGISYDSVEAYNMTQDYWIGEVAWPVQTTGGDPAGTLPAQCSPLCLFLTAVLGSLGRKFLPAFSLSRIDSDGSISATGLGVMLSFVNAILAGYTSGSYSFSFGNYRAATADFIAYVSATVRDLYATQRRRYVGVGS